ncbi:MAG: cytochrome c oxidase subunit II [Armatimonadota bacterium]|nr:cytochrome c oxidase subunit II [Armatimonadota bacterium]MDR7437708.1 cytochrome c oxidase subunit II [Armatimonadota bacterium]MDR7472379.1 cytochrome c oxidase subunit II [Armatimonadota bacterium]MDR7507503.1 cytochrome c oxidase subunit II [Armatimonadota bacterium]MDR7509762.1 cytochrome c oxidase subunit II [Armatimonadota bacterium]
MARHAGAVAVLWGVLTVLGLLAAGRAHLLPVAAAREARIIDDAFRFLLLLAVPVFTFVLAALAYSVVAFRGRGEPPDDGPPLRGRSAVPWIWLAVTGGLAVYVIFNPGLRGLAELRADRHADLVVRVEGSRWVWRFVYPDAGVTSRELVLPVGRRVRFEVTAADVVHSFWIPAFRVKVDAVPGMVTTVYVTPTRVGDRAADVNFRVQCAELCGLGHHLMASPVRVVDPEAFREWAESARSP